MRAIAAAILLAVACPHLAAADADANAPAVAVYRGGSANVASPVAVHRGSAVRPAYLAPRPTAGPAETVGGRGIWFVDREQGELTACRLVNTFTVGQRRIRCTRGRLPD